ncbi:hypothetical protein AAVH_37340 [Aphelenchoides avenae]|nr:hypothetical protein AAVH_37340 [Aphelenchus avenae]
MRLVLDVRAGMELLDEIPLNDTSPWTFPALYGDMEQAAKKVLDATKGELEPKGWARRQKVHKKIVEDTVLNPALLKKHRRYFFNALAFLPYYHDDERCVLFPKHNFIDAGNRNLKLNYFVLHADKRWAQPPEQAWHNLTRRKDAMEEVLAHVFAQSNDDVCGRLTAAVKDHVVDTNVFGGVAAVKCGYEFVWYELGYRYFYAAYSSTKYKWGTNGGGYDSKCGQIFLFP